MSYEFLLSSLESILGKGIKTSKDNHAFTCPFCNHRKPKLEINLATDTQGRNFWECWVCKTKGRTVKSLLFKLKIPKGKAFEVLKFVKNGNIEYNLENSNEVVLPKEFIPIYELNKSSFATQRILNYLYGRGLSDIDIYRYNIGYCSSGEYEDYVIIPSYNKDNILNSFIGRSIKKSFFKYKSPKVSRNVIFFENLINWNLPVILVEGVFDAIAVRSNAIPLLGKSPSRELLKKISYNQVSEIIVALDNDAKKEAFLLTEKLFKLGKKVSLIKLDSKDPSDIGYKAFYSKLLERRNFTTSDLLKQKILQYD